MIYTMKRWFVFVLAASVSYMCVAGAPRWISGDTAAPEKPAPVLLKEFVLDAKPKKAVFTVAVAGWCEVRVNGEKVGRDVLSPVTCQPDKRTSSLDFDVTDQVRQQPHGGVIVVSGIEVKAEDGSQGSGAFDVDVNDWGDYEDIYLPLM
jgi:hypothetical protein